MLRLSSKRATKADNRLFVISERGTAFRTLDISRGQLKLHGVICEELLDQRERRLVVTNFGQMNRLNAKVLGFARVATTPR